LQLTPQERSDWLGERGACGAKELSAKLTEDCPLVAFRKIESDLRLCLPPPLEKEARDFLHY